LDGLGGVGQNDPPAQETKHAGNADPITQEFPEYFHGDLVIRH
jgi:hypothetical protein